MILSVSQSFRCRAIYASDLLFLRKKSPVVPIHQNCLLLLSTQKKPADQPLHVSTSVENLKFKCETAAVSTVMKKKNITGVYLATRWAVPNLVYHQLNALALTPYPTLSIMTLNLSPGKAGYASWRSIGNFSVTSILRWSTEVVNESHTDIELWIRQRIGRDTEYSICNDLKAGKKRDIMKGDIRKYLRKTSSTTLVVRAGSEERRMYAQYFINNKKFVFNIDANGKLVGKKMSYKDCEWEKIEFLPEK